ncbi:hypothetical protein CAPTEDRAFT_224702 [Capitella teleta]|uniref:Uncharacterized protein n=1 Tax=Capitella teleta TaxID=283909 RepID=R7UM37_CAPTE|nr:hypothetical protein CAPTEDRAFT_224702 [Capitella teleta]|eukprot:ELU07148.1 hypothetical protein CAPTEDRAFT_224702 [Capitella teleta]
MNLLVVLILLYGIPLIKGACENGWSQSGSKCYQLQQDSKSQKNAYMACLDKGAALVCIEVDSENEFIKKLTKKSKRDAKETDVQLRQRPDVVPQIEQQDNPRESYHRPALAAVGFMPTPGSDGVYSSIAPNQSETTTYTRPPEASEYEDIRPTRSHNDPSLLGIDPLLRRPSAAASELTEFSQPSAIPYRPVSYAGLADDPHGETTASTQKGLPKHDIGAVIDQSNDTGLYDDDPKTDIRHQIKKRLHLIVNSTFKMGPLAIAVVFSFLSLVAGKKCANEMDTDSGGVQVIVNYLTSDQATCETSSSILERTAALEREVDFLKHAGAESGAGEGCGCPSGPTGPPGRVGPSGPRGPRGLKGARGTFGGTGATGLRGSTGVGGRDGAPGAPGAPGRTGSTGATGYQGQTGATGWLGRIGAGPS